MLYLLGVPRFGTLSLTLERALYLVAWLCCLEPLEGLPREVAYRALWPEADEALGKKRLRQLIYRARQLPYGQGLSADGPLLSFDAPSDVGLFLKASQEGAWTEAMRLYGGELLSGASFDSSDLAMLIETERGRLSRTFERVVLAHASALSGEPGLLALEAALEREPWSETILRALLEAAGAAPKVARRAFERYRLHLRQHLQLEPPADLLALAARVQRLAPVAAPVPASRIPAIFGRESELAVLRQRLAAPGVLVVQGAAGVGKTALARQLAGSEPGSVFVSLHGLRGARAVLEAITQALGGAALGDALSELEALLAAHPRLVVLDDLASAQSSEAGPAWETVQRLQTRLPAVRWLVTTREAPPAVPSFTLRGLPEPQSGAPLETQAAARVFARAAQRSLVTFRFNEADRTALARICAAVQGNPRQLERAAAWVRTLTLEDLAEALERGELRLEADAPFIG